MRRLLSFMTVMGFFLVIPYGAWAKPAIALKISTAREVVKTINGEEVRKIVPAVKIEPGQTLIYTLQYRNNGDEKATNAVINNPIPKGTVYLVGSATGADSEITFSIDGGKSFKQPTLLTYEITEPGGKSLKKTAAPEEYTHVQWLIKEINPGQQGEVTFHVKVQ